MFIYFNMKNIYKRIIKNICLVLFTLLNSQIANADICSNETSTQAKEFWIAFMQNHDEELTIPHGLDLIISVDKATHVDIIDEVSNYHWFEDFEANTVQTFTVPCQLFNTIEYGQVVDRTLHITSTEPISVYMNNHQNISSDATLALPISACDSYYIIQNADASLDSHYGSFMPSVFSIISFENNTKVEITPTLKTSDGHPANETFTVTMHKGQVYQVASTEADLGHNLSGSQIKALNGKKVAVYTGNRSANIPYAASNGNSNILCEMCPPVSTWGKNFIIQPFTSGFVDMIKCTACNDSTKIYKNGKLLKTINALESYEFLINESDGAFKLETSEPVCVYQYMSSNNYVYKRANGGPSQLYVNPIEQAINKLNFCTPPHELLNNHFVNIVIRTKDAQKITLDGKTKFTKFTPVDDMFSTGYAIVSRGQHTLEAPTPFIANLYGMGDGLSYAYCAGSNVYKLNTESNTNAVVCAGDTFSFGGIDYSETGFYIDTLINGNGCDSLAFLTMKVLQFDTVHYYDTITIGDSYIKHGFSYIKPNLGVYDTITGVCPHFTHLELVVEHERCYDGTLIFKEDFGGNKTTDAAISTKEVSGCTFNINTDPRDQYLTGRYSIRKVSYNDKSWTKTVDHTYPDSETKGYFMQCDAANNVGEAPGVVYSVQIDNICEGVPFLFSFWGMSMIKAGADSAYADACLKLVVEDTDGNVLRTKKIDMRNGVEKWTVYGLPYELPKGMTSAVFKILNNSTIHYGNDFAIDDIEIRVCHTAIEVEEEENVPCIGAQLSLLAKNDKGSSSKSPVYEWYYSKSSDIQSSDWVLVGNEKRLKINSLTEKENGYYRVFVGEAKSKDLNNNCSSASNLIRVEVGKCETPVCKSDTVNLSTCLVLDTLISIIENDKISRPDNANVSLIDAPSYAKIVDNKLSYTLTDSKIKADTITYAVKLGAMSDTADVIFKINHPSTIKKIDTLICYGTEYKEMILFKDTILADTTFVKETGCPDIVREVVTIDNIDATIKDTALCEGDSIAFTIKTPEGAKYEYNWYYDEGHKKSAGKKQSISVVAEKTTSYYIVVNTKKCSLELETEIEVLSRPYLEDVEEIKENDLELIADGGSSPYEFSIDSSKWTSSNKIKDYERGKLYDIQIRDDNGCTEDTTIKAPTFDLEVPSIVTPNGDGINDVLEIKNLERYPNATVQIYERHGKILIDSKEGEFKSWDGYLNGQRMHNDDYWYVIEIKDLDKTYIGHFTLHWDY